MSRKGSAEAAREAARERQSYVRHELRAPLAVMYPALSLLLEGAAGELTPRQREYVEIMERNVMRLDGMVNSVADSGWSECAAVPAQPTEVSLGEVVEGILAVRRFSRQPGPRVDVHIGPRPLPRAVADHDQVQQVLTNLIDNAAHFTPASGSIEVRLAAGDAPGTVTVTVADTGCGVPDHEREQVFDFGFRGVAAIRNGVPGIGLGLWICRELVERNGGSIALAGGPGAGTTVTVVLPAAGDPA
jgi:two-component system phosphate regulon sensor histidine kinase PhoR